MQEMTFQDSIVADKKAATKVLEYYNDLVPKDKDVAADFHVEIPLLVVAERALQHIKKHGGKIDPALVGMLSISAKLEDVLSRQPDYTEYGRKWSEKSREVAAMLADEIAQRDLVALPVISRSRGRG